MAQREKKLKKKEQFYDFASKLYEQYLRYFPGTESAYELRFFWAELLYRKGSKIKGKRRTTPEAAKSYYARAARQYNLVARKPRGQYRKQAAFSEILCLENLANRTGSATLRGAGQKLVVKKDPKTGKVTWTRKEIKKGSWDARLLVAYERYLKVVKNDKEERLQTYFKTGTIYYSYKHYLKSMKIFADMAREFPNHELSRQAAFMILYSYEDLNQWEELEKSARLFIKDKTLTKNERFKNEMYEMLIRSSFLRVGVAIKEKNMPPLEAAQLYAGYELEFGKEGKWHTKRGFKMSPASDRSLGLAGINYNKAKRILKAIAARERLVKVYTKSPYRNQIKYELGNHYEQIANYNTAATWYERYVFGKKDYMKILSGDGDDDDEDEAKKKKKKARRKRSRRRSRRSRRNRAKKLKTKKFKIDPKKKAKQMGDALYKAAAYRRGLAQFEKAIALYRHYIKKYDGKDKDVPNLFLAIASIREERKQWDKALATYNEYLEKYQNDNVTKYLKKALRLQKKNLDEFGIFTRHEKPNPKAKKGRNKDKTIGFRRQLGTLKKEDVTDGKILFVHAQIAAIYGKQKKFKEMEDRYMMVDSLGYQMYEQRVPAMSGPSRARASYARAKFFLAERRRRDFVKLKFVGHSRKDRKILKKIIKGGKLLARDYTTVASLQYPDWVLAAVFRIGEIYHQFAKKIYSAPMPKNLPQRLWGQYKMAIEGFAARFEEVAIDAYDGVLKKSASMGLYNEWVRLCEDKRNEINRKQGNVNPHTIFSKRLQKYWLVEPVPTNLKLNVKVMAKKKEVKEKPAPKKEQPAPAPRTAPKQPKASKGKVTASAK